MRIISFLSIALLCLLYACSNEPSESTDLLLQNALMEKGGSEGLAHFELPDSEDYNSIPQDPLNPITRPKVELGKLLFHETALASEGNFVQTVNTYSCASCHHADGGFQANVPQGIGDGGMGFGTTGEARFFNPLCATADIDVQPIRSPSILNSAYQTNMLWNGQFGATGVNVGTESQWTPDTPKESNQLGFEGVETQAIAGLGVHRFGLSIDQDFIMNTEYKELFDIAFNDVPDEERYAARSAGLAIAAYERTVLANHSPFQNWLKGDKSALTENQKEGALLFFSNNCVDCHTGPALSSMEFHGFGFHDLRNSAQVINIPSEYTEQRGRGGFTGNPADDYKFKVPQLYNLKDSKFYGHGASFNSLEELIAYKVKGIPENLEVPASQLASQFQDYGFSNNDINKLVDFIENGLYDPSLKRFEPTALPSGNCFPNNDALSRVDLGCL